MSLLTRGFQTCRTLPVRLKSSRQTFSIAHPIVAYDCGETGYSQSQAESVQASSSSRHLEESSESLQSPIFEPLTWEYTSDANISHPQSEKKPVKTTISRPSIVLERMLEQGDYEGAWAVREDLRALNVKITPHTIFFNAARHALSIEDVEARRKAVSGWWSSVPTHPQPIYLRHMEKMAKRILSDHSNLPLAIRFALVCARSNFIKASIHHFLPYIMKYASPEDSRTFVNHLERLARSYKRKDKNWSWMLVRNEAIKELLKAGRRDQAREMYAYAMENIQVFPSTHRMMLSITSAKEKPASLPLPDFLFSRKVGTVSSDLVARHLRNLRRALSSRDHNLSEYYAEFIYLYHERLGRTRALHILRRKVFSPGFSRAIAAQWIAGEQLYCSARKKPIGSLRLFVKYCSRTAFFSEESHRILEWWDQQNKYRGRRLRMDSPLTRSLPECGINCEIQPTRRSLVLALQSILQLTDDLSDIERLYSSLLARCESERKSSSGSSTVSTPESDRLDGSFFHPFVIAFATRDSPRRALSLFSDMRRLGIDPGKANWATLAAVYARSGDYDRTERILKSFEENYVINLSQPETDREHWRTRLMYMGVVRGFIECGMGKEAMEIYERAQELGYTDKTDWSRNGIMHRLIRAVKGRHTKRQKARTSILHDKRQIFVDPVRVDWLETH